MARATSHRASFNLIIAFIFTFNQQMDSRSVFGAATAAARPGSDGKKCLDKVEMFEETEYDETIKCDHSHDRRCHTTYVTNYESQQEEECEENCRRNCFINYEKNAFNETVQVCRTPLVKDCDVSGPEICRTEYESECWIKQEEHDVEADVVECETIQAENCRTEYESVCTTETVTNYVIENEQQCATRSVPECATTVRNVPEEQCATRTVQECTTVADNKCTTEEKCTTETQTVVDVATTQECQDIVRQVCTETQVAVQTHSAIAGHAVAAAPQVVAVIAPAAVPVGCGVKEGAEVCQEKAQTIVQNNLKEECSLEHQRTCAHVTKLVVTVCQPQATRATATITARRLPRRRDLPRALQAHQPAQELLRGRHRGEVLPEAPEDRGVRRRGD